MPDKADERHKRDRLERILTTLLELRTAADDLNAYLLAAKIEDSRVCVQDMIDALR